MASSPMFQNVLPRVQLQPLFEQMTYFGDFESNRYENVAEKIKVLLSKVTFDDSKFIITQLKSENKLE